jgi:hypothetical protein
MRSWPGGEPINGASDAAGTDLLERFESINYKTIPLRRDRAGTRTGGKSGTMFKKEIHDKQQFNQNRPRRIPLLVG